MNAKDNLLLFLNEWRRHTAAETAGIRAQNWAAVKECQMAKQRLQSWLGEAQTPVHITPLEREVVQELVALEKDNARLLANQKANLQLREKELEETSRNLKRVRGSYVRLETLRWQSYS